MERWNPLKGHVGIITAFNFPCAVFFWNAALSLVCGNTNLWKPAESVSLTAIACTKVCRSDGQSLRDLSEPRLQARAPHEVAGLTHLPLSCCSSVRSCSRCWRRRATAPPSPRSSVDGEGTWGPLSSPTGAWS